MCNSEYNLKAVIDDALAVTAVTVYDRLVAFRRAERILRAALLTARKVYGPNSPEVAHAHLGLGIALHNIGLHSEYFLGIGRRFLCSEAESSFLTAARIYGYRTETIDVLRAHVRFNNWTAMHCHNEEKRAAIYDRSNKLEANIKSLTAQLDADRKKAEEAERTAASQGDNVGDSPALAACRRMADVADSAMRSKIEEAITAGIDDSKMKEEEKRAEKEAAHARQLQNSASRAEEIIAGIPDLIRDCTAKKLPYGSIMELDPLESEESPGWVLAYVHGRTKTLLGNPESLRYAARLVFDYCQRMGLKPEVHKATRPGQDLCVFELRIKWSIQ
jgi:hypothetical protein